MIGRIAFTALAGLALAAAPVAAQPAGGVVRPDHAGASLPQLGSELFAANCSVCHGKMGEGVAEPEPNGPGGVTGQGPPLIGVGAAAPDFYLRSGRMPLGDPAEQPERHRPYFGDREIRALVAYVDGFGGGEPIPEIEPDASHPEEGRALFTEHCAGCHQVLAEGGYVTGARVPPLQGLSARTIAEAVRVGPYVMPAFPRSQIDDEELAKLIAYVRSTDDPADPGGLGIGHVGPIPEGFVAWLVAGGCLVALCVLLGERLRR